LATTIAQPTATATARILVVDGDPAVRSYLESALGEAGHAVETAAGLDAGLRRLADGELDLLVVDRHLPDGSGLTLLQTAGRAGLSALLMTDVESLDGALDALMLGAADFLTKPLHTEALLESIREALETSVPSSTSPDDSHTSLRRELREALARARGFEELAAGRAAELELAGARTRDADRGRREFVSNLSHELRSGLSSVKNSCEILQRSPQLDDRTRGEFLEIVEQETDRLIRLLNDITDLERLDASTVSWHLGPVQADEAVERATLALHVPIALRGLQLETCCQEQLGLLQADSERLHRVLLAILENAVNYSRQGGKLTLTLRRMEAGDRTHTPDRTRRYAEILVTDEGPGMTPETRKRACERFYQGMPPESAVAARGSGLGLTLAKRMVAALGGALWLDSAEGRGTTVGISLPLLSSPTPDEDLELDV
jgi:signal transduction histidine kinase